MLYSPVEEAISIRSVDAPQDYVILHAGYKMAWQRHFIGPSALEIL